MFPPFQKSIIFMWLKFCPHQVKGKMCCPSTSKGTWSRRQANTPKDIIATRINPYTVNRFVVIVSQIPQGSIFAKAFIHLPQNFSSTVSRYWTDTDTNRDSTHNNFLHATTTTDYVTRPVRRFFPMIRNSGLITNYWWPPSWRNKSYSSLFKHNSFEGSLNSRGTLHNFW